MSKLPDVNAKNYRTKVNQVAGPALKKWVKENIIKDQDYKTFINDNYNNIRDLGIDYLIDLDKGLQKQGKPRMFTEFNKKLTTQAEIRKYRDSGRAFVENEAQGVSLFDIKNPGPEAMVKFFTDSKAQRCTFTLNFGRPLDPWIPVKRCCRPDGSAIQPILAVPGPVRDPAHAQDNPKASQMRSKAITSSQNGPQKACPRTSNGIQMVSS